MPDTGPFRSPDVRIAAIAAEQKGVVHFDDLRACGLSRDAILTRVRRGNLHPVHLKVYAVGHPGLDFAGRCLAATMACRPGTLAARSHAAALHGFVEEPDLGDVEVLVPGSQQPGHPGIAASCSTNIGLEDTTLARGVPVTSPARTIVDLAAVLGDADLRRAIRRALGLRLTSIPQILATMDRLGPRRGARRLARVLADAAPTRSELENVVLDLLLNAGFVPPAVNQPMVIAGRTVVPDFRWAEQGISVEADGRSWHDNPIARADDAERQALLESVGDRVLRITWRQAIVYRSRTIARLRDAGVPLLTETGLRRD